jgi:hypothetical protein
MVRIRFCCLADGMCFEAEVVSDHENLGRSEARTPSGQVVALSIDADLLWRETFVLVERALAKSGLRIAANSRAWGDVLSSAIDPAPNGERYVAGRSPDCPNGHDADEYVFNDRPVEPPVRFDRLVDLAEHDAWDALSSSQKEAQVERIVADSLAHSAERKARDDEQYARYREMRAQGAFTRTSRL